MVAEADVLPERVEGVLRRLLPHERALLTGVAGGERAALEESRRLKGSVYFETFGRVIHGTRSEGRLSLDEYPVWREPLDAATDDETRELTIIAGAQTGKTSACRMMIVGLVDRDPAPAIIVLPQKDKVRRFAKSQIIPTVESIPGLSRQLGTSASERNQNCTQDAIRFHHGSIMFRYAGRDPDQLKSDPARYAYVDETEGLPADIGGEGDPFSLIRNRQRIWQNTRKLIDSSTPGALEGMAAKRFLSAGSRARYYVPCLRCGEHAVLAMTGTGLASPEALRGDDGLEGGGDAARRDDLAEWYGVAPRFGLWIRPGVTPIALERKDPGDAALVCPHCGARAHEDRRMEMVQRGRFVAAVEDADAPGGERTETIGPDGVIYAVSPSGERVRFPRNVDPKPSTSDCRSAFAAYSLNVLSSPVVTLMDVAHEFKSASRGGVEPLQAFVNNWLAEPFVRRAAGLHAGGLRRRVDHATPLYVLPHWTVRTLLVADTQADGWWWGLFAIGAGSRTHLAAWDFQPLGDDDPDELVPEGWLALERIADRFLPVWGENGAPSGLRLQCAAMFVDSGGDKTTEVYAWCQRHARGLSATPAYPVKGDNRVGLPWLVQRAADPKTPDGSRDRDASPLLLVNTHAAKDRLAALLTAREGISARATIASDVIDPATGEAVDGVHEELFAQLSSEHKVVELVGRAGRGKLKDAAYVWRPVRAGRANHLLDVGGYFCAAAEHLGLWGMDDTDERVAQMARAVAAGAGAAGPDPRSGLAPPAPAAADRSPRLPPPPRADPLDDQMEARVGGMAARDPGPPARRPGKAPPKMPSMERLRRRGGWDGL